MDLLITLLTIVEVLVCLLLILIILMQRPRQEGLGASFGEGVTSQMWGAQTTNVLQKGTSWLAGALFVVTVILASLVTKRHNSGAKEDPLFKSTPAATIAPAAPDAKGDTTKTPAGTVTVKPGPATPAKPAEAPAPATPAAKDAAKPATTTPAPAPAAKDAPKPAAAPAPATAPAPKVEAKPAPAPAPAPATK